MGGFRVNKKKKICVVVQSRANYGRIKSAMHEIQNHDRLELQLIVGASAILERFGNPLEIIKNDGFQPAGIIYSILEGENPETMAKSTGIGIIELSTKFRDLNPDVVLTVADRFETMSTAIAASYMNIVLAHTQGGEITGSIDESVRHAITKLSHIHFPATEKARDNIIKMGEDSNNVFLTGCPSLDLLQNIDLNLSKDFFLKHGGVGSQIDPFKKYIVVLQHPVTTEFKNTDSHIKETLKAVKRISDEDIQVIFLWPNVDAGSDKISKYIRSFRETNQLKNFAFFKNFEPEDYIRLIQNSTCLVGNSSSGIREGSFLGVPCVNIGNRQSGREKCKNVIDVKNDCEEIFNAVQFQIKHGIYPKSKLYGSGNAGKKIANILASNEFSILKRLTF